MSGNRKNRNSHGDPDSMPPQWLIDELAKNLELLRVVADLVRKHRKSGTKSTNRRR